MADMTKEQRHPHLPLVREERSAERRKHPAPPIAPPNRGGRGMFSGELNQAAERMVEERNTRINTPIGIQPHLVFRIPFAEGANINGLIDSLQKQAGLDIVSVETDRAVIAFRDDLNLKEFEDAVNTYKEGPREGINPRNGKPYASTASDFLEYIEPTQMRLWGREDRIGERLKDAIVGNGGSIEATKKYVVEIELWHLGGAEGARRALDEVKKLVQSDAEEGERVLDTFAGQFIVLAKIAVNGRKLEAILEMDIVAEVELPPQPQFEPLLAMGTTERDFPRPPLPPEGGPRLCIIDSGIASNHPLLANNVGHEEAILTQSDALGDANGHGTMVAGLAVYGDVRACYEAGLFASQITLYSARVLNERNEFDDEKLIVNQMRTAVETFRKQPYDCRIFNISLGCGKAAIRGERTRQTLWAEELDVIAREMKVVLIVSAGNHYEANGLNAVDSETALRSYPGLLFGQETGLCDPATAAIAVTVGSIAQHDTPVIRPGSGAGDITRPLARMNEPSAFTRVGPGVNGAIKPEFVHFGGNVVFSGFGNTARRIDSAEPGTAVMSLSDQPTQRLFAYNSGTSYAAPRVARLAALIESNLTADLGERPTPNLIRAVLAASADIPAECSSCLDMYENGHGTCKVCGYGLPKEEDALKSHDRRVTMVHQGSINIDHFSVFAVPIPEAFQNANGERKIIVTLAYDPPVRRRRLDYLGVEMDVILIRGKTLDQVYDAYRSVGPGEEPETIQGACRIELEPKANPRNCGYSRKKSTLQRCQNVRKRPDRKDDGYGDEYYLVVRCERKWKAEDIETQDYGLAVTLCAADTKLYNQVAMRIGLRTQAQVRERARAM